MFADLETTDIQYRDQEGRRVSVQTEHRDTTTLEEDAPRSAMFALARVLGPLLSEDPPDRLEYGFAFAPPPALQRLVEAAGAVVLLDNEPLSPLQTPSPDAVLVAVGDAMQALGEAVIARHEVARTGQGLEALEAQLAQNRSDFEASSAEQRYTAQLELAAAASVVILAEMDGSWVLDVAFQEPFPFTLDVDGHRPNLFGRAARFYAESAEEGPSGLLGVLQDAQPSDGLIMPLLRPASTGQLGTMLGKPLIETTEVPDDLPHIYLAEDRPSSVSYINREDAEAFDLLLTASLENLRRTPVDVSRLDDEPPMYLLEGFYGPSKLLDLPLLSDLADRLNATHLWVGVPGRELAIVTAEDPEWAQVFVDFMQRTYDQQLESQRVSPRVMVADPAKGVVGWLELTVQAPSSSPSGWWKKMWS